MPRDTPQLRDPHNVVHQSVAVPEVSVTGPQVTEDPIRPHPLPEVWGLSDVQERLLGIQIGLGALVEFAVDEDLLDVVDVLEA